MQQNSPITDAVLVTVQVKQSGASKLYFQDEKALTGKKIFAIEAFSNNDIATTPLGQPIINQSAFDRSFITITNSKTGLIIYSNYSASSSSLKPSDLKSLAKSISKQ